MSERDQVLRKKLKAEAYEQFRQPANYYEKLLADLGAADYQSINFTNSTSANEIPKIPPEVPMDYFYRQQYYGRPTRSEDLYQNRRISELQDEVRRLAARIEYLEDFIARSRMFPAPESRFEANQFKPEIEVRRVRIFLTDGE